MARSSAVGGLLVVAVALIAIACGGSGGGGGEPGEIVVRMGSVGEGEILGAGPGEHVGTYRQPPEHFLAAIWHEGLDDPTTFDPSGFTRTVLVDTDGSTQVGWGLLDPLEHQTHALMFKGSLASMVDLNPAGYYSSLVSAVDGDTQGGGGQAEKWGENLPLIWKGSAASVVILLPQSADNGHVSTITGDMQAGWVNPDTTLENHAARWHGTAASFEDLHPEGYVASDISGSSSTDLVGTVLAGTTGPQGSVRSHAFRWAGNSRIDLHPTGASDSFATATTGSTQVGKYVRVGETSLTPRACLWHGTAASFVDLHALLPSEYASSSAEAVYGKRVLGWANKSQATYAVPVVWELP